MTRVGMSECTTKDALSALSLTTNKERKERIVKFINYNFPSLPINDIPPYLLPLFPLNISDDWTVVETLSINNLLECYSEKMTVYDKEILGEIIGRRLFARKEIFNLNDFEQKREICQRISKIYVNSNSNSFIVYNFNKLLSNYKDFVNFFDIWYEILCSFDKCPLSLIEVLKTHISNYFDELLKIDLFEKYFKCEFIYELEIEEVVRLMGAVEGVCDLFDFNEFLKILFYNRERSNVKFIIEIICKFFDFNENAEDNYEMDSILSHFFEWSVNTDIIKKEGDYLKIFEKYINLSSNSMLKLKYFWLFPSQGNLLKILIELSLVPFEESLELEKFFRKSLSFLHIQIINDDILPQFSLRDVSLSQFTELLAPFQRFIPLIIENLWKFPSLSHLFPEISKFYLFNSFDYSLRSSALLLYVHSIGELPFTDREDYDTFQKILLIKHTKFYNEIFDENDLEICLNWINKILSLPSTALSQQERSMLNSCFHHFKDSSQLKSKLTEKFNIIFPKEDIFEELKEIYQFDILHILNNGCEIEPQITLCCE